MYLSIDEIEKLIADLDRDTKALKKELFKLCWYMRGGISYSESLNLSGEERDLIAEIVEENLKVAKESGMPFF